MSATCPKIDVLYWNATKVTVKCPYREELHRHGVKLPGRRASDCSPSGQYEFIFPIDESSELVGFEIDKRRACFVNSSLKIGHTGDEIYSTERDDCELADSFRSAMKLSATESKSGPVLNLYGDAREVETITISDNSKFEQKRVHFAIFECILGNLGVISHFLHGKDKAGNTTLIRAAAEKSHEMVSLLLQNDADGRCAMDLAQPTRRNEKERYSRSHGAAAESVPERDRDRRHIQHAYTTPLSKSEQNNYCFRKSSSEMAITLQGPIECYPVPRITKTAAILHRGNQFTRISATSGWGTFSLPPNDGIGPHWIEQVYYIASIIGHRFQDAPYPSWDQGKLGQYFASHAEKKLIAYFLDKHIFMPKDREPDQMLEDSIVEVENSLKEGSHSSIAWARVCDLEESKEELDRQLFNSDDRLLGEFYDEQEVKGLKSEIRVIDEELSTLESDAFVARMRTQQQKRCKLSKKEKMHQDLMELSENEPPISLKCAVILSSNKVCEDCDIFRQRVNDYFQLNIEMSWRISSELGDPQNLF
ncbi:DYW family of nucleic acid deaminases domain-containing protein [Trichoderma barbatum]